MEKGDIYVDTLRKYRDAVGEGYYAQSNAEMKMSVPFFQRPLDVLEFVEQARILGASFLNDLMSG